MFMKYHISTIKALNTLICLFIFNTNSLIAKENKTIFQKETTLSLSNASTSSNKIFHRISSYFINLGDAILLFEQTDQNNSSLINGALLISKNLGLRCNYFEPNPLSIVLYKSNVSIYDYDLNSLVKDKIEDSFWNFLLTGFLDSETKIIDFNQSNNEESITLYRKDTFEVKIVFQLNPIHKLSKISIIEHDGKNTVLSFKKIRKIKNIAKELFIIRDPKVFGKPNRYNLKDLEKKFSYVD